jgi:hypothetical protein
MLYNNDTNVICLIDISLNIFDGFLKEKHSIRPLRLQ